MKIKIEDLLPIYQALSKNIGLENTLKLAEEFGGQEIYFPKLRLTKERDRMIIKEFTGGNTKELAKKYSVTPSWIRQVLKRVEAKKGEF